MAEIVLPTKALAVNPLKASQPIGASLAFLGLADAMPLEHGARGCTSFNKLFFMRHFREPIALQTTAMDQTTTVLGADGNVVEALATICGKNRPSVIGLITTGLSETQGADIPPARSRRSGRLSAISTMWRSSRSAPPTRWAIWKQASPWRSRPSSRAIRPRPRATRRPGTVNVLASAMLTPGDIEAIKDWIAAFGLTPIVLPDIADSARRPPDRCRLFDAYLWRNATRQHRGHGRQRRNTGHWPFHRPRRRFAAARTGVPDYRFPSLMGLKECDAFTAALAEIAGLEVPAAIQRKRAQLRRRDGGLPVPAGRRARRRCRRSGSACRDRRAF